MTRVRLLINCLCALYLAGIGRAASQPKAGDPFSEAWRWQTYQEPLGRGLRSIAVDQSGRAWLGTDAGIGVYDGHRWIWYGSKDGLPEIPYNCITAATNDRIVAGSDEGLFEFDGSGWSPLLILESTSLQINDLMIDSSGRVWAGSAWGIFLLEDSPVLFTTPAYGNTIEAKGGNLNVVVLPAHAVSKRAWSDGIGIRVAESAVTGLYAGPLARTVVSVQEGGPGWTAGLRIGDSILNVNGNSRSKFNQELIGTPGESVALAIVGVDDEIREIEVVRATIQGFHEDFAIHDLAEAGENEIVFATESGRVGTLEWHPDSSIDVSLFERHFGRQPSVCLDSRGRLWAISGQGSLPPAVRDETGKWRDVDLRSVGGSNGNTDILPRANGSVLITASGKLHHVTDRVITYDAPAVPVPSYRPRVAAGPNDILWVLGLGQDLARLDTGSERWQSVTGSVFQGSDATGRRWFLRDESEVWYQSDEDGWVEIDQPLDRIYSVLPTKQGLTWIVGSIGNAVAVSVSTKTGWQTQSFPLVSSRASRAFLTRDGSVWIATGGPRRDVQSGGVLQARLHEGELHVKHWSTTQAPYFLYGAAQDRNGDFWLAGELVKRFDGNKWNLIGEPWQIATTWTEALLSDPESHTLWFGTRTQGVFSYDGDTWRTWTVTEGLADNRVRFLARDQRGRIHALTPKGVSTFDGNRWQRDGLPSLHFSPNTWKGIVPETDGIWYNCRVNGREIAVRYTPASRPPDTQIRSMPERFEYPTDIRIQWYGIDAWNETPASNLQFAYRVETNPWSDYRPESGALLEDLPPGAYRFQVRARDIDGNADPTPASGQFVILAPVHQRPWFIGLVLAFAAVAAVLGRRTMERTRERDIARQALIDELEDELDTAREMQMDLMPREQIDLPGYDIDGVCHPANHVGGDYYQFFRRNGTLNVAMADVTGHAMEAAIPVVMFSGILETQIEVRTDLLNLFSRLNSSMVRSRRGRTFVCFTMVEIDLRSRVDSFTNAACPYPYVYHANSGQIEEIQIDSYPLGIRDGITFEERKVALERGDYVVFCSDGIIEAEDMEGRQFGYDQTHALVKNLCSRSLSAREVMETIVSEIETHRTEAPQSDDITCVVIKVTA